MTDRTTSPEVLGKADWRWEPDLGCHVPGCTVEILHATPVGMVPLRRCGNGPLIGDAILTGDCGEHSGDIGTVNDD